MIGLEKMAMMVSLLRIWDVGTVYSFGIHILYVSPLLYFILY